MFYFVNNLCLLIKQVSGGRQSAVGSVAGLPDARVGKVPHSCAPHGPGYPQSTSAGTERLCSHRIRLMSL